MRKTLIDSSLLLNISLHIRHPFTAKTPNIELKYRQNMFYHVK